MSAANEKVLLVGVDGGASGVRAWAVRARSDRGRVGFDTEGAPVERTFADAADFTPLPLEVQLAERAHVAPGAAENAAAQRRVDLCAEAVIELAQRLRSRRLLVGACMPGLKTPDGRGIAVLRNGPRCVDLVARWEALLTRAGLELAHPIGALLSDGEASAIGEDVGLGGGLRDVMTAYYVGGGTGLSEGLKIEGQIVGMDDLEGWPKAWELCDSRGVRFEDRLSMRALNAAWAERKGSERAAPTFEEAAHHGDDAARRTLTSASEALAELNVVRAVALAEVELPESAGRAGHPPLLLERTVVGQRLGQLFADKRLDAWLLSRATAEFRARIGKVGDRELARRYLALEGPRFVASTLRSAPAIGAALRAFLEMLPGSDAPA